MSSSLCNVNIGILGHVDSGKTSLAKVLSTNASTAAFDKNPQSVERGITIDLGFSSFSLPTPDDIPHNEDKNMIQYTLVDCPGHASLIRTIIGGSHIIDMMILVIDINKGIQTQTAECIVLGQLTTDHLIVVLNKIDTIPEKQLQKTINRTETKIKRALSITKFQNISMIPISSKEDNPINIELLHEGILKITRKLKKIKNLSEENTFENDPFRFSIDHCFSVKGQGTVLTGTVLSGMVSVNQNIEFPLLKIQKKVKSIQMFRKPVTKAVQGDRIGICVTQFNAKLIERGVAGTPGAYIETNGAIISASKIKFFKGSIKTKGKMHISIGHSTVMASLQIFSKQPTDNCEQVDNNNLNDFDFSQEYLYQDELREESIEYPNGSQFILLYFEKKIICPANCMVIGSKLDADINSNSCRLAFNGKLLSDIDTNSTEKLKSLKIYKPRQRSGIIDRAIDEHNLIGNKLFKKETNMNMFIGLKVIRTSNNEEGKIESSFGKSGKFKVYFQQGKQSGTNGELILHFKKFIFDTNQKKISQ